MKILITGGSGFIGRHLVEKLSGRYAVSAPTHAELELLDAAAVAEYVTPGRFDVVIHSATWDPISHPEKEASRVLDANLRMFFNIARRAGAFGKMIYFGSGAEFSRPRWKPRMSEDYFDVYVPEDQYGFSKYLMNKHAERSKNIYNLRLFAVYGRHEDPNVRFLSSACSRAARGMPITIRQNVNFDFMHVDDLCRVTEWFVENSPQDKTFNVCAGQAYDLVTLARKVLRVSSKDLPVQIEKDGQGREYSGDNSRLLSQIGAFAFKDIDQGIAELYEWYRSREEMDKKDQTTCSHR